MKVIVSGLIATYPMGGMSLHYLQYVLGFHRLGCEVLYLEDTGQWTYDPSLNTFTEDYTNNVAYLAQIMKNHDLSGKWSFRTMDGHYLGKSQMVVLNAFRNADLFINVSGSCWYRPEYQACSCAVYLDTDPGYNQIKVAKVAEGDNDPDLNYSVERMADHHYHFTFGENIGRNDCTLPTDRFDWHTTRQPVVLDLWSMNSVKPRDAYTTVMSWNPYENPVEFHRQKYFGKEAHLERVIMLPRTSGAVMELAISGKAPIDRLTSNGWRVVAARDISQSLDSYMNYIKSSRGEFSVAKDLYVSTHSGWFSERSACYLAASRPVILEDTGFSKVLPTGEGLHAFSKLQQAVDAVSQVSANYSRQCQAARALAEEYFDSDKILRQFLGDLGF